MSLPRFDIAFYISVSLNNTSVQLFAQPLLGIHLCKMYANVSLCLVVCYASTVMANLALHIWREVTGLALIWEQCLSLMLSDATEHALHKQLGHSFGEGQDSNSPVESAPASLWGHCLNETRARTRPLIGAGARVFLELGLNLFINPCV